MTMIVNGYKIEPGTDFTLAYLSETDLSEADLMGAVFLEAQLVCACLWRVNLTGANLSWADLRQANLLGANLTGAKLIEVNLRGAVLWGANLIKSDLSGADLRLANFGPNGPDPRNFVGCIGLESAIFDDGVKEALIAGIESLKAEGVTE